MFGVIGFQDYLQPLISSGNNYINGLRKIEKVYNVDIDAEYSNDKLNVLFARIEADKRRSDVTELQLHYFKDYYSYLKKYSKYLEVKYTNCVIDEIEPETNEKKEINYKYSASKIKFEQVLPPQSVQHSLGNGRPIKSLNEKELVIREKNKKRKGNFGEEIALKIEEDRLRSIGRGDLISRIEHVAKKQDGLGYDIKSVTVDSNNNVVDIYIEVKSTESENINRPFYISEREIKSSEKYKDNYYIYRIFNLKEGSDKIQYFVLNGDMRKKLNLTAVSYYALIK